MPQKLKTCASCKHLVENRLGRAAIFPTCGQTGNVVPHSSLDSDTGRKWELTFFRVPICCPRPDREVEKIARGDDHKRWEKKSFPWEVQK